MASEQTGTRIRLGIQPTCWTNDDFPEIGDDTPYQTILDEMRACGFEGGSTGHNYPSHLPSLKHALSSRCLAITSTWVGTHFTAEGQYNTTLDNVRDQIAFLKSVGSRDIVCAELASAVHQLRTKAALDDRPIFNEPQWSLLAAGLDEAGRIAADAGLRLCYHPHIGTGVQTRGEIDRLMCATDPSVVFLCLDTGHAFVAGVDPIQLTRDYISRIKHVHLKNVREPVMKNAVSKKFSFYRAIREGIFTVPGDKGGINFAPIFQSFQEHRYEGWIVVEAEQDPVKANPRTCATIAREFIQNGLNI